MGYTAKGKRKWKSKRDRVLDPFILWVTLPFSALWLLSEIGITAVTFSAKQSKEFDDNSLNVMVGTTMSSVALGIFLWTTKIGDIPIKTHFLPILGLLLMIFGITLRWVAILTLKKYFSINIAVESDHKLIRHGLYRFIRHPSYTGSLICFLGMGLSYSNCLSLLLMFFAPLLALVNRIRVEEKVLNRIFGNDYSDYASKTKKLLPWIY
ncbi:MAG TPA: hypothetical protein DD435_12755 [Cyanobacteria bacterium UBA8530]|nr:hypothetical protein [Cyanobacteria bacterium UBA8530]